MYGDNIGAVPATYVVSYFGENITNGTVSVTATSTTIDLPAVDSDVNVFVTATNVFGTGNNSDVLMNDISELYNPIVYTYIHICICIHTYVHTYIRICIYIVITYIRMYIYTYTFEHTTIFVHTHCILM